MSSDIDDIAALDAKAYASQRLVAAWIAFGDIVESNHCWIIALNTHTVILSKAKNLVFGRALISGAYCAECQVFMRKIT